MYKFVVFKDKSKQFRIKLVASNGEIVLTSESYVQVASAFKTINSICQAFRDNQVSTLWKGREYSVAPKQIETSEAAESEELINSSSSLNTID